MPIFKQRSRQTELLDEPNIPANLLHQNLYELDVINRWLGGHKATLYGLQQLMQDKNKVYHIADFGCGGGDTLRAIATWAKQKGYQVKLTGFDLLPEAINYAAQHSKSYKIDWHIADFNEYEPQNPVDISICALFCHHLYDKNLDKLLQKMTEIAQIGVVINDLQRHAVAYYGIKLLTQLFSRSPLVKNDAPLSVLKGFSKKELTHILQKALPKNLFQIKWIWAFRWLVIIKK